MASEPERASLLELAHVLYMDLVEYSRLSMADQARQLGQLQGLLRATEEFRRAEAAGDLICRPTGDGIALVFFRDPVAPVRCAMELAEALRSLSHLRLRMGVHTGPVYRVEDINASQDVTGGGINIAQRVMTCGDAGHILVSSSAAELLTQLGDWSATLHDLGRCEVKHGAHLHLYNLYTDELGNPALPEVLRSGPSPPRSPLADAPLEAFTTLRAPSGRGAERPGRADRRKLARVALLYKRFAQPDHPLTERLEAQLTAAGHSVFIDRHLAVGVEWAKTIEREIRTADAVIPLLSAASVQSEMLAYEVKIAHEAAQVQNGKPRLLPVRIDFTDPLPEELAAVLDPLHYTLWEGPQDEERLVSDLLTALQAPSSPPLVPASRLEAVGGAMPLDSRFYVVRLTDDQFHAAMARRDSIVLIRGARQMGKTSLLARGLQQGRELGATVVRTDFQKLNAAHLATAETFFAALADSLADQLDLDLPTETVWNPRRGPSVNFERYLRREILGKIDTPLVWGLDEVDRLFTCNFGSEVFGLFRSWHNERALDPTGPWSRLTLAIAYAREAHLFITDLNQSPFNVGTRLTLEDFFVDQVADLNGRYGSPLQDETEVARFHRLLGGQPYLVGRGLLEMASHGMGIDAFETQADREDGIYGDHLRRILVLLARDPDLEEVLRLVLRRRPCPTEESFYRLRSAGIITGDTAHDARLRCQLYAVYLQRHLR